MPSAPALKPRTRAARRASPVDPLSPPVPPSPSSIGPLAGAPLFVAAPTTRCGTTLLQRVLNSSSNALVLGEVVAQTLLDHVQAYAARAALPARAAEQRRDLERALRGEPFWCPHLTGDAAGFVALFRDALERFVRFHEAEAHAHGRSLWGAKLPTVPVDSLRTLRAILPGSKVIYVVRDLVAAAASAKARRFLRAPLDFERFAERWQAGVIAIEALRADPHVLVVTYEDLARCSAGTLRELAAFTGARDLDPRVLKARVNTWPGAAEDGHAPGQYIAPAELDEAELVALERHMRLRLPAELEESVPGSFF
jgi:hypothetical protein